MNCSLLRGPSNVTWATHSRLLGSETLDAGDGVAAQINVSLPSPVTRDIQYSLGNLDSISYEEPNEEGESCKARRRSSLYRWADVVRFSVLETRK